MMFPSTAYAAKKTDKCVCDFTGEERPKPMDPYQFGHAFTKHGQYRRNFLIKEAKKENKSDYQGMWRDNNQAAEYIKNWRGEEGIPNPELGNKKNVSFVIAISIPTTPKPLGVVLDKDGNSYVAKYALIVPALNPGKQKKNKRCLKSAYPILEEQLRDEINKGKVLNGDFLNAN